MTLSDVMTMLESQRDERGINHWQTLGDATAGLRSYGIGLTHLRKLAKQIGRHRALSQQLWNTDLYDAKVIALLIDDPAYITPAQAEQQVEEIAGGMLLHVFASCDATLAKTSFVVALSDRWLQSEDPIRRHCGYNLLYEISKFSGKKAPEERFFLEHIERIEKQIATEEAATRLAMGAALMGMGKRSAVLNRAALQVAQKAGPIAFSSASGDCEPFDVVKHLTSSRLLEKLGLAQ